MTCKQFFKSTTFRCIIVLVCIALVSGGLLAILNDLWNVSDEEQINLAIKEVCGESVSLKSTIELPQDGITIENGKILSAYILSDNSILIKALGEKGYHSGTVTLYVLATKDGDDYKIKSAKVADYASSQTLMSKFGDDSLKNFVNDPAHFESGATKSSKAVRNALIAAEKFFNNDVLSQYLKEGK